MLRLRTGGARSCVREMVSEICTFFCGSICPALRSAVLVLLVKLGALALLPAAFLFESDLLFDVLSVGAVLALVSLLGADALSCFCAEDFGASAVEDFGASAALFCSLA